ncbi:tegument protein VP13/14-2 [Beluga whale alphaherpesvirus 1]|uniref:Tegument protein UL47 n=1 Tax=Beluga whale alphaherpesvirus 1 TaxID=1434720 RepID=A0A286RUG7_9ALPH|nr:tegument protein VP13/14-2 [Beluga whale alphaherpesvirus 1]ASW27060.1 tegument protein VP13/14-2 [Beluga whale alphaherpesvirus 1]
MDLLDWGWGPMRRPRRSLESRARPFRAPGRGPVGGAEGPGARAPVGGPTPAAFGSGRRRAGYPAPAGPPAGDETSDEEVGDGDAGDLDGPGGAGGAWAREDDGAGPYSGGLDEEWGEGTDDDGAEGGEVGGGEWGDEEMPEALETDDELDGPDSPLGREASRGDDLTACLRRMEDGADDDGECARRARRLYADRFDPGELEGEEPVPARLRTRSRVVRPYPPHAPTDVRVDYFPNAAFASWSVLPENTYWVRYFRTAMEREELEIRSWQRAYDRDPACAVVGIPAPEALPGVGAREFFGRFSMEVLLTDVYAAHADAEDRAWNAVESLHGQPVVGWGADPPKFSPGGMYVSGPDAGPLGVWRRALRQAAALQHAMCIAPVARLAASRRLRHQDAVAFLLDALIRVAKNCHYAAVEAASEDAEADAGRGRGGPRAAVAYRRASLLRALPPRAAGALAATRYTLPASGVQATAFRRSFGGLLYWPALRAALRTCANIISTRYTGATLQATETLLLARAHSQNPRYTPLERSCLAMYFTLETLLLERAAQWMYVATAFLLSDIQTLSAFSLVRATVPFQHAPLGCLELADAESEVFRHEDARAATASEALAQAFLEEYMALRATVTMQMTSFAVAVDQTPHVAMSAYTAVALIVQRLAGHVNMVFCCLAGSAVYGGQRCEVWAAAVARYAALADALAPLARNAPLAEFWEARDAVARGLGVTPRPGPPVAGNRRVVRVEALPVSLDDVAAGVPGPPGARLGPRADLAELLRSYPHLVREAEPAGRRAAAAGGRGCVPAAGCGGRRRRRRGSCI